MGNGGAREIEKLRTEAQAVRERENECRDAYLEKVRALQMGTFYYFLCIRYRFAFSWIATAFPGVATSGALRV